MGAHRAARTALNHGDDGGGGDVRHLGFLSTGFPPIEAHKLWLRGRSGRVQYTRCSLFSHTKRRARSAQGVRSSLSLSRARAGAPDLSRPSLCLRRAQELRRPPHETRWGYPVRPRAPGRPGRGRGVPEKKWWESPLFAYSSSGIGGLLVEGGRGLRARERRTHSFTLLAPSSTWQINLLLVPPRFFFIRCLMAVEIPT